MTDIFLKVLLVLYIAASVGLLVYGLNAYVMLGLMLPRRKKQAASDRKPSMEAKPMSKLMQ